MFPPATAVICGTLAGFYFWGFADQIPGDYPVAFNVTAPLHTKALVTESLAAVFLIGVFLIAVSLIGLFLVGLFLLRRNAPPRRVLFSRESNNYLSVSYLRYRYGIRLYLIGLLALFCTGFCHGFVRQMSHQAGDLQLSGDRSVVPAGEQVFLCLRVRDFPVHVTTGSGREYMRMECRLVLYSPDGREQIPGDENIQAYVLVDSSGRKGVPVTDRKGVPVTDRKGVPVTGSEVTVSDSEVPVSDSEVTVSDSEVPSNGNVREASNQWLPGDVLFTRCRSFPFTSNTTTTSDTTTTGPNAITNGSNANPAGTHPGTTDLHASTTDPHATTAGKDNATDSAKTNTTTFNYAKYMARRGFFRRAYIYDFQRVNGKLTVAEKLKRLKVPITRRWEGEAGAILSGICLGDKTGLTREMRDLFSRAGAGHILAVSGLHVGILYASLVLLLGLPLRITESRRYMLKRSRRAKIAGSHQTVNPAITETPATIRSRELYLRRTYSLTRGTWIHMPALLLIWTYAAVVGFSASVVRAALMLTIYGVGKMTGRRAFGLNVLSITALILVIIEPMNLYDIGFQMSFSAVLGLILFFPLLRNLLSVRNRPLKYIWELFCCSLAVQLGTIWLTSASFGMIPLYGLFCNLAVVPFCTVILYVFLCYLILLWISAICGMNLPVIQNLNDLLHLLAEWLENTVSFFAGLPYTPIHYQPGPGGQFLILFCTLIVYILLRKNDRNL